MPALATVGACLAGGAIASGGVPGAEAPGQPLAANVQRLVETLGVLGRPLARETLEPLLAAVSEEDADQVQKLLDPHVFAAVTINPESRVKVERGPAPADLQQAGYVPFIVKVVNLGAVKSRLRLSSPQGGPPYGGVAELSMQRQQQLALSNPDKTTDGEKKFLHLEMFSQPPMTPDLSGLSVEYCVALAYSSLAGQREATLGFDVGQGTQDLGFRAELPILFDIRAAVPVELRIRDHDGSPAFARLTFRDAAGHVYPPQARRLAPDFFFQKHLYRRDGEIVLLPAGELQLEFSRGPEYRTIRRGVQIEPESGPLEIQLERWVNPSRFGFYSGDHHIHGAGCAHYNRPTEGVLPEHMFRQVAGEGLNVGCVLTWGPCFEYQRQFFRPEVDRISEALTILKYDLEISGFGSQALGHVCLLNLKDQTYPGSEGTKEKGWPTWATPALRWAKAQGAVTGYAHSASGLQVDPPAAAKRLFAELDEDQSGQASVQEAARGLLPADFDALDADRDRFLTEVELQSGIDLAADRLPNLAIPEMNSVGAMELPVSVALGACDFISAMDTARLPEWNMWYHVLNCGFPLKVSGETDFPCMSSTNVGQGRVYVQLGQVEQLDFAAWCENLAKGRSYVSDGYGHALEFAVNGQAPGDQVRLAAPATVTVLASVAFAPETPVAVAHGTRQAEGGRRFAGDTVTFHGEPPNEWVSGGKRLVELVVNGNVVASQRVPADGQQHALVFETPIARSSWVALRHFPQLHTNPVEVSVGDEPIRASRQSARWCQETIRQLWRQRQNNVSPGERGDADAAFKQAIEIYRQRAAEAPAGS